MADTDKELERFAPGTVVYVRGELENIFLEQEIVKCIIKESSRFADESEKILIQMYPESNPEMEFALDDTLENESFFFDMEDAKVYNLVAENE